MEKETKQILDMIVEKANKLRSYSFEKHVAEVGLGFKGTKQDDGTWLLEFGIPDVKERDAFLLTFRLFYQENEPISFPYLLKLLNDPSLSDEFRNQVALIRQDYFDYITGYSNYTVKLFEGHPTRKQMIDVGLYGGLAHTNRLDRIEQYRIWARDDVRAFLFEQEFAAFLLRILDFIYKLSDSCLHELEQNPANTGSS
jgi:hypothetical protein